MMVKIEKELDSFSIPNLPGSVVSPISSVLPPAL